MIENESWMGEGWYTNGGTTDGAIWAETEEDLGGLDSEYHGDEAIPEEDLRRGGEWVTFDPHYVTEEVREAADVLAYAREVGADDLVTIEDVRKALDVLEA